MLLKGLPPIVGDTPTILILGSMPSVASLEKQQYYGHPRNAFWRLMAQLNGFEYQDDYARNVAEVSQRGIAIWDVIGECERPGSLDSAIVKGSERLNPIPALLEQYPDIQRIGLNGGTAARLFKHHCLPVLQSEKYKIFNLPSTSPANAGQSFEQKCQQWQSLIIPLQKSRNTTFNSPASTSS